MTAEEIRRRSEAEALRGASPSFSPVNYDTVRDRGEVDRGFRQAGDGDRSLWRGVIEAYGAGDKAAVNALLDQMRADGNFSGYYDEAGNYTGFARGFNNDASGSYQPVIGGKLITHGMSTDQWLTPDGKIYSSGTGVFRDTGNTWSYAAPAAGGGADLEGEGMARRTARAIAAGDLSAMPSGRKLGQTKAEGVFGAAEPAVQAPGDVYDPETDPLWQNYLARYEGAEPPEWRESFDFRDVPEYRSYLERYEGAEAPAWQETFDYRDTPEYRSFLERYEGAESPEWGGSPYEGLRDAALERAAQPWSYTLETDPAWQAYRKQYVREGRRSGEDTLGQYAAMTGGMPSSAAMTAARQAASLYDARLTDKIPELYRQAYQRYLQEYQRQLELAGAYDDYGQEDYSRYRDRLGQWNTDRSFAYERAMDAAAGARADYDARYGQYRDALGQWNTDRSLAYGQAMDALAGARADYDARYGQYRDALDRWDSDRSFAYRAARDSQAAGRLRSDTAYSRYLDALEQRDRDRDFAYRQERDALSDRAQDREWAQKLREYADAQGWKAEEWRQYLEEYGDKLDRGDREWAYQQYRDAVADARYEDETGYNRARQSLLDGENAEDAAYQRALTEAKLAASYGDLRGLEALGITPNAENLRRLAIAEAGRVTPVGSGSYRSGGSGAGDETYSTSTVNAAYRAYLDGDRSGLTLRILRSAGLAEHEEGGASPEGGAPEDGAFARLDGDLTDMQARGMPWKLLQVEMDAELRDGRITPEEYETLRQKYLSRGREDGVPNLEGAVHRDGSPMSAGFAGVWRTVRDLADRQNREQALAALRRAGDAGTIHEYEIDIMLDQLGW